MKTITKIDVLSASKITGALSALTGFIIGIITLLFSITFSALIGSAGYGFGLAMLIIFPVVYGIIGFIMGAVFASFYNFIAKKIGGIQINLK